MVAYVVSDLGPGDGGKGGVVNKLATSLDASIVIKTGGAQGSHGVGYADGSKFAFSQWGCGTREGIKSHISKRMVMMPEALLNEADALRYQFGIDGWDLLTADGEALCATPYHGILSKIKELARKDSPRGTIGTGVGEAFRYSEKFPQTTIRLRELRDKDLIVRKLKETKLKISEDLKEISKNGFLDDDLAEEEEILLLFKDEGFFAYIVDKFYEVSQKVRLVKTDYLRKEIFSKNKPVVVESSHGVLTDSVYGFYPHVSAIRTLPLFARGALADYGFDGIIKIIGVTRAYSIRHGAGPLPTDDPAMAESLLPGSCKDGSRYQGMARVGPLDFNLLRYAIEVSGGSKLFDGLAITWFDQIIKNQKFIFSDHYQGELDQNFFNTNGRIKVIKEVDRSYQESLSKVLMQSKPKLTAVELLGELEDEEAFYFCNTIFKGRFDINVKMVSLGPSADRKICRL